MPPQYHEKVHQECSVLMVGWLGFLWFLPQVLVALVLALTFYRELRERTDLLRDTWLVRMEAETPRVSRYCSRCPKFK